MQQAMQKSQAGPPKSSGKVDHDLPKGWIKLADYKLPVVDCDTQRRNFPGYEEAQLVSVEDLKGGDTEGTTETDSKIAPEDRKEYTKLNKLKGKVR